MSASPGSAWALSLSGSRNLLRAWLRCNGPGRFSTSSTYSARGCHRVGDGGEVCRKCLRSSSVIPVESLGLARLAVSGASWGWTSPAASRSAAMPSVSS